MPWGKGMVVEEAYVTSKYHQPTIQLLQFNNGDKVIRFCSYNEGRFSRAPLMVDEKDLTKARQGCSEEKRTFKANLKTQ